MNPYYFEVEIEAKNEAEAAKIFKAMKDLHKAARKEMTTLEFIDFAANVKPSQIKLAKVFVK
jgi:hypothetical protein